MATAVKTDLLYPELDQYKQRFENARKEFRRVVDGLDDAKFNLRPEPDRWSAAECFDHLVVVGTLMNRNIDEAIDRAINRGMRSDGPFKYGALGNWLVNAVGPSDVARRRRFKAPKAYTPASNHSISRLSEAFDRLQSEFIERLQRANGLDLARIKVPSAAGGIGVLMRLSLGLWFALLANHQDRHIAQAWETRAQTAPSGN